MSFPEAIVKSVLLPEIYSVELPYWICFPEVNNKPTSWTCVNDTSSFIPNDKIELSLFIFIFSVDSQVPLFAVAQVNFLSCIPFNNKPPPIGVILSGIATLPKIINLSSTWICSALIELILPTTLILPNTFKFLVIVVLPSKLKSLQLNEPSMVVSVAISTLVLVELPKSIEPVPPGLILISALVDAAVDKCIIFLDNKLKPPCNAFISIPLLPTPSPVLSDKIFNLEENWPANEIVKSWPVLVAVVVILEGPLAESILKVEESIVNAPEASISNVEASISIGLSAVVPIAILVSESIVNAPEASISNVDASISIGLSTVVPIAILVAESIVNSPEASISNVEASISIGLSALLPILIRVSESNANIPSESISIPPAVVFISIALVPVPAELIAKTWVLPPTTSNVRLLLEPVTVKFESSVASIDKVLAESIVNAAEVSMDNVEASISIGLSTVVPISILVAESIVNAPEASISNVEASISIGISWLLPIAILVAESNVKIPDESISIPPALAFKTIASLLLLSAWILILVSASISIPPLTASNFIEFTSVLSVDISNDTKPLLLDILPLPSKSNVAVSSPYFAELAPFISTVLGVNVNEVIPVSETAPLPSKFNVAVSSPYLDTPEPCIVTVLLGVNVNVVIPVSETAPLPSKSNVAISSPYLDTPAPCIVTVLLGVNNNVVIPVSETAPLPSKTNLAISSPILVILSPSIVNVPLVVFHVELAPAVISCFPEVEVVAPVPLSCVIL